MLSEIHRDMPGEEPHGGNVEHMHDICKFRATCTTLAFSVKKKVVAVIALTNAMHMSTLCHHRRNYSDGFIQIRF